MKPCPMCAEAIEEAARKCKHCGEYLDESARVVKTEQAKVEKKAAVKHLNKLSWVFALFAYFAYASGAKLLAQVLFAVGLILAVGVHLRRTA